MSSSNGSDGKHRHRVVAKLSYAKDVLSLAWWSVDWKQQGSHLFMMRQSIVKARSTTVRNTLWWELEIICVDITYVTVKNAEVRREQSGHPLSRDMLTMMF